MLQLKQVNFTLLSPHASWSLVVSLTGLGRIYCLVLVLSPGNLLFRIHMSIVSTPLMLRGYEPWLGSSNFYMDEGGH
jgi:hypothetical protein